MKYAHHVVGHQLILLTIISGNYKKLEIKKLEIAKARFDGIRRLATGYGLGVGIFGGRMTTLLLTTLFDSDVKKEPNKK